MSLFTENTRVLWQSLRDFTAYAPAKLSVVFLLMLAESFTAGVGLMLIFPLLPLIGIEVGAGLDAGVVNFISDAFALAGLPLSLIYILLLYVITVTTIASLRFVLAVQSASIQQAYIYHLRNSLYERLLACEWSFVISHRMSDFNHALTQQVQGVGMAVNLLLQLCSQLVLASVMVVLVLVLSWKMSLLAILFAALLLLGLLPINRNIYRSGNLQLMGFRGIYQQLGDQLASLKMIKSYGGEKYFLKQFSQAGKEIENQMVRFNKLLALSQWLLMVGSVCIFSAFFFLAKEKLSIALSTILVLLLILSRLLPQIAGIQKTWQQLLHRVADIKNVKTLDTECIAAQEKARSRISHTPTLKHSIILQGISFKYSENDDNIIDNFSTTIPINHTVALVGPSGSGKSTLADLIAGLLEPQSGTIYCDQTALIGEQRFAWRNTVAYVTQEVHLFHDTIRANLSWVSKDLSDDDLWCALSLAAADFVSSLPEGLDTVIGDRGTRLSGGERQRLVLARALLCRPQLLILDEATSNLDSENEIKIREALRKLHGTITILVIAHRPATIESADQVISLGYSTATLDT